MLFPSLAFTFALWGLAWAQVVDDLDLPDVVAPVGRVFSLPLGSHAVYGDPRVIVKITLASGPSLPRWLVFNTTNRLLAGVPLNADRATHIISVSGTCPIPGPHDPARKACNGRTDVFQLTVAELGWDQAWDAAVGDGPNWSAGAQDIATSDSTCDGERVVASLVLCASVEELGAARRLTIAQRLAGFMSIPASSIKVEPSSTRSLVALHNGMQMVFAGPGSETVCDLGQNMEVLWALTCSSVRHLRDFAQVLQHNVDGGRLQGELGVSLVGWYVASSNSLRTRQGRRRRGVGYNTPVPTPSPVPITPASPTESEAVPVSSSEVTSTVSATATVTDWSYGEPSSTATPAYSTEVLLSPIDPTSAITLTEPQSLTSSFSERHVHILSSSVHLMVYSKEIPYSGTSVTPVLPAVIATDQYITASSDPHVLKLDSSHHLSKTSVYEVLKTSTSDILIHDDGPTSPALPDILKSDDGPTSPALPDVRKSDYDPTSPALPDILTSDDGPTSPALPDVRKSDYDPTYPALPDILTSDDGPTSPALPDVRKSDYDPTSPALPDILTSDDGPTSDKLSHVVGTTFLTLPDSLTSDDGRTSPALPDILTSDDGPTSDKLIHDVGTTFPTLPDSLTSDDGRTSPALPDILTSDYGPTSRTLQDILTSDYDPTSDKLSQDFGPTFLTSPDALTPVLSPTSSLSPDTITSSSTHLDDPLTSSASMDSLTPNIVITTPPLPLGESLTPPPSLVRTRTLEILPPSQHFSVSPSTGELATATVEGDLVIVLDEETEVEVANAQVSPGSSSESSQPISTEALQTEAESVMAHVSELASSTSVTPAAPEFSSEFSKHPMTHVTQPFFQIMTHDQHTTPPTLHVTHDHNTTQPSYRHVTHYQNTTHPSYPYVTHYRNTTYPHVTHDQNTTHPSYPHVTHDENTTHPSYPHVTHDQNTTHPSYRHVTHDQNTTHPSYHHVTHDQNTTHPSYHHVTPDQNTTHPSYHHVTPDQNTTHPSYHHVTHDQNTTHPSYHHVTPDQNTTHPSYHHVTRGQNATMPHTTTKTEEYETHIKTNIVDQTTTTTTRKPSSKVTGGGRKKPSTTTATTSTTTPKSAVSLDGYSAANNRPFVRDPIKTVVGQAGKVLDYLIGSDVFTDVEDGDTRSLMLSLELPTREELPSSYWLYLDADPQVLRGLPLKEDLTLDNTSVYLVATDSGGLSDRTPVALQIVDPPRINFTHSFIMTFDVNFKKFMEHRRNITRLVKNIGTYFGDSGAQSITVLSVRQGSFILSWTNHTLAGPNCPRDLIDGLYKHMTANINDLRASIGLNLRLDSVAKEDLGACLLTTSRAEVTTTTHLVSNKLDEGFSIWAHVVLPVLIAFLVFVLIILIIIFCNRRRRQNQAAINAEKEAISNDRNPIIFPDEIETDEPALQAKDPLILPSDLQTSNQSSPPDSPSRAGDSAQDVARSRHSRDCQDKEWVAAEGRRKEEKSRRHSKESSSGRKHSRDGGKKQRDRMSGVSASSSLTFDRPNNHYLDDEEGSSRNNTLTSNKSTSSDKRNSKQPPPYWQSQTDPPPYRLPPPYLNNTTQV